MHSHDVSEHVDPFPSPGEPEGGASFIEYPLPAAPSPVVLYVDRQRLTRDCISEQFATHLSEWLVEPLQSAHELQSRGDWPHSSLAILNTHGAGICTPGVADEMATIAEAAPGVPLAVMSDLDDAMEISEALHRGVRGYLPGNLPISQAITALRLVGQGGTYIPACVANALGQVKETSPSPSANAERDMIQLSPREQQVLKQLQQGQPNKVIAHELNICTSTVKVHVQHIMKKLNARNRTQIVLLFNRATTATVAVA